MTLQAEPRDDQRRPAALDGGHRVDDSDQPPHVGLDVGVADHLGHVPQTGNHAHDLAAAVVAHAEARCAGR